MGRSPVIRLEVGQRIGRGVVLNSEIGVPNGRRSRRGARLLCDCGNVYEASLSNLTVQTTQGEPHTASCGCIQRERAAHAGRRTVASAQAATRTLDGLTQTRTADYKRWQNMMARCYNPDNPRYLDWGGRGIQVCERWHDFRLFIEDLDWLLGPCPEGWTLDRSDNDGNYEPGNVRWADYFTQNRNRRARA